MTPVDPAELPGMEFDWLATDDAGHLAQMLSSGHGRVPDTALSSEEDLFALHLWLDEQPLSEALSIPEGTFQALLAQPQRRGLYVYDAQPAAGDAPDAARSDTYILLAAPTTPLTLEHVPEAFRAIIPHLPGHFGRQRTLTIEGQ